MSTEMTAHHEFEALLGAYALGALDLEEQRAIERHVASCASCQSELKELRRVANGLGLAAEDVPPPALKKKIIDAVTGSAQSGRATDAFGQRQTRGRRAADHAVKPDPIASTAPLRWLAAASVILAVAAGAYALKIQSELTGAHEALTQATTHADSIAAEMQAMRSAMSRMASVNNVLGAPDVVSMGLSGKGEATTAVGRMYWSKSRGMVFTAEHLPKLPPGKVYQLWVVTAMKPMHAESAGVLAPTADGAVEVTGATPAGVTPMAIAVSIEPAGGSAAPTTAPVLMSATQ